jgi:hypothetical protein
MKIIFVLIIILVGIDFVFNDALILNKINSYDYPIPILLKLLFIIISLLSVVLLIHAIIMEWNLWPKITKKKTIFELEKEEKKDSHKKKLD